MTVDRTTGEITADRPVRPFAEWLVEQRKGFLAFELADALNELVDAVNVHGKSGSLTLTVKVEPGGSGTVLVTDDVVVKLPKPKREAATFFVDRNSNLTRANPDQPGLPLREVPAPPSTLKEAQ